MSFEMEDCKAVRSTAKALLVDIPEAGEEVWTPRSQIESWSEVRGKGDEGSLVVTDWFAEKVGWL